MVHVLGRKQITHMEEFVTDAPRLTTSSAINLDKKGAYSMKKLSLALTLIGLATINGVAQAQDRQALNIASTIPVQGRIPVLSCCDCLGKVTVFNLSTGQGSPADPIWRVNSNSAFTTPKVSSWIAIPGAQWIQPAASPLPSFSVAAGTYNYTVAFNVPKCVVPSDVRLTGTFSADNGAKAYLDSNLVGSCTSSTCFTGSAPLTVPSSALTPGNHTLRIEVTNNESYSGLIVNAKLTRQCAKGNTSSAGDQITESN
jgi:hypothetical protein